MKILPDLQTIGSLAPHTLILEMGSTSRPSLESSLAAGPDLRPARIYSHELHHWFDIIGTPWGQDYLDNLFAAYEALEREKSEEYMYFDALRVFDFDRAILFPSYFKYVANRNARHTPDDRWMLSFTSGSSFHLDGRLNENKPILFARFSQSRGEVSRQPLTVGTLLELRALSAEIRTFGSLSHGRDADTNFVDQEIFLRELTGCLYEPELTTYSAAAHTLAFGSGVPDPVEVICFGSMVADYCLSLTQGTTNKLVPPDELNPGHRGLHGFRSTCNQPYVFACLAFLLGRSAADPLSVTSLNSGLSALKMPSRNYVYGLAIRSLKRPVARLKVDWLDRIRESLRAAGSAVLEMREEVGGIFPPNTWIDLPSPFTITCESEEFHIGRPIISGEDSYRLYDASVRLSQVTRQALRAARGMEFSFTDFAY